MCRFLQGADLRGTVCLRFLDPFGDTTFNQLQIVVLVEELQGIVSAQPEPEVRDHLRRILDLAIRARGQAHTYLKFFGD
ncbi:MAG TPA: hypothetical protein VFZ65_13770 [Planctomycetota bacterium]|nr:hypothetical protein [Planctomycetota bacterium]